MFGVASRRILYFSFDMLGNVLQCVSVGFSLRRCHRDNSDLLNGVFLHCFLGYCTFSIFCIAYTDVTAAYLSQ